MAFVFCGIGLGTIGLGTLGLGFVALSAIGLTVYLLHPSSNNRGPPDEADIKKVSRRQFNQAIKNCGFSTPSSEVYEYFISQTKDFSLNELAMFMAQLIHESAGFQCKEEIAYAGQRNHGAYDCSPSGKDYHGRGYIQLTWAQNYKDASNGLGLGDELVKYPERVAEKPELAMLVSVWFWRARVRPQLGDQYDSFGLTTKAINGDIECDGEPNAVAKQRYQYYLKVADAFGVQNKASECGCYNC